MERNKRKLGLSVSKNIESYLKDYNDVIFNLHGERSRGLAAAFYTQTTDVEIEVNGLLTYDRRVTKLPINSTKKIHKKLFNEFGKAEFLIKNSEILIESKKFTNERLPSNWVKNPKKINNLS